MAYSTMLKNLKISVELSFLQMYPLPILTQEEIGHQGTRLAQSEEHETLDLGVMSMSPMLDVAIT